MAADNLDLVNVATDLSETGVYTITLDRPDKVGTY